MLAIAAAPGEYQTQHNAGNKASKKSHRGTPVAAGRALAVFSTSAAGVRRSSRITVRKPTTWSSSTTENGIAPVTAIAFATSTEPLNSVAAVSTATSVPHTSLYGSGGFSWPSLVIIESTKLPESAEVTRKMKIRNSATKPSTCPSGKKSRKTKKARLTSCETSSAMPPPPNSSMKTPAPPSTANQKSENNVGTMMTPAQNSRMVRPRLMRAMKIPTNGPQASHQIM